jgi:hypothetical protein
MDRKFASKLAVGCVALAATLAAGVITRAQAAGGDPASGDPPFVSTLSREEVAAELKKPYPGGNPWSGQYNMFQGKSTTSAEQVEGEFLRAREEVNAVTSEDSGSAFLMKNRQVPAAAGSAMGAPGK